MQGGGAQGAGSGGRGAARVSGAECRGGGRAAECAHGHCRRSGAVRGDGAPHAGALPRHACTATIRLCCSCIWTCQHSVSMRLCPSFMLSSLRLHEAVLHHHHADTTLAKFTFTW